MSVFANSFFSLAGQKERLANVGNVLVAAVTKGGVSANVENKTIKAGLEFVANNPFETALVAATGASGAGRAAVASTISKAPLAVKVGASTVGAGAAAAAVTSERIRVAAINTASALTPSSFIKAGVQTGKVVENPSLQGTKDLIAENKAVFVAAGAAAAIVGGTLVSRTSGVVNAVDNLLDRKSDPAPKLPSEKPVNTKPSSPPAAAALPPALTSPTAPADVVAAGPAPAATPDKIRAAPKKRKKKRTYKRMQCSPTIRGYVALRVAHRC